MKINVRPIEAFEVTNEAGDTIATVRLVDRWQGMARLVTDDGQTLVVDGPEALAAQFGKSFAQAHGSTASPVFSLRLVKASPDLLHKLGVDAATRDGLAT